MLKTDTANYHNKELKDKIILSLGFLMVEYSNKMTSEQYQAVFKKRIFLDEQTNYSSINIPMLAVCGQKEVKEVIISTEELGRRNLNCKTLILDNERHDFPQRNADLLNPILLDFIR